MDIGPPELLERITFLLKLALHTNRGGTDEEMLEKCISVYNEYKKIESEMDRVTAEQQKRIKKLVMRINLILKQRPDGSFAQTSSADDRKNFRTYPPHPILYCDHPEKVFPVAEENSVCLFTGVPMTFLMKEGRFQIVCWNYIRAIFFITQYILASAKTYPNREQVQEDSLDQLEKIVCRSQLLIEELHVDQKLSRDNYLRRVLFRPEVIDTNQIENAKQKMYSLLKKRTGRGGNASLMCRMVDQVADRINDIQNGEGSLAANMFSTAKEIAMDMKPEMMANAGSAYESLRAVKSIFDDAMEDSVNSGEQIAPELAGVARKILQCNPDDPNFGEENMKEIIDETSSIHGFTSEQIVGLVDREGEGAVDIVGGALKKMGI